jgi:hypothetical protein
MTNGLQTINRLDVSLTDLEDALDRPTDGPRPADLSIGERRSDQDRSPGRTPMIVADESTPATRGRTPSVAALAIDDASTHTHEHHRSRLRVSLVASLVAFGVAIAAGASTVRHDETVLDVATGGAATTGAAPGTASDAGAAIESWLADHHDQLFAGAPSSYVGSCATDAVGLCSTMTDDLGDAQVHIVGVTASDWGADVLVEQGADGTWQVTGVEAWPALGDRYDGAPWSPTTAITSWWYGDDRAATMYGADAIHLARCDDAPVTAGADDAQPLLCSTLVEDGGTTRVYDSGLAGHPADVRITLERQPDRTWAVVETLAR